MDANNPDSVWTRLVALLRPGDVVRLGGDDDKPGILVLHVFADRSCIAAVRIPRFKKGQVDA
jgi:hypothetical protein